MLTLHYDGMKLSLWKDTLAVCLHSVLVTGESQARLFLGLMLQRQEDSTKEKVLQALQGRCGGQNMLRQALHISLAR